MATRFTRVLERASLTSESNGTGLLQDPHLEVSESVIDPANAQSKVETQHNPGSSYLQFHVSFELIVLFHLTGGAHLAVDTPALQSFPTSLNVDNGPIVVQGSNPVAEATAAIPQGEKNDR